VDALETLKRMREGAAAGGHDDSVAHLDGWIGREERRQAGESPTVGLLGLMAQTAKTLQTPRSMRTFVVTWSDGSTSETRAPLAQDVWDRHAAYVNICPSWIVSVIELEG
jgi:hypothetical protein